MERFAKNQLEKHGWKQGKGLGRNEHGIKEAIRVKIKTDQAGVGHDLGEQFTYHWWDHVFNKAANNIQVDSTEDGVNVHQSGNLHLSTKKPPAKAYADKTLLYGRFIKAATLHGSEEVLEDSISNSSEDDSEDRDTHHRICTDEDMLKACGGRTAHKAARHGLKLNGKLLRIQQQEATLSLSNLPSGDNSTDIQGYEKLQVNKYPNQKKKKPKKSKKKLKSSKFDADPDDVCESHVIELSTSGDCDMIEATSARVSLEHDELLRNKPWKLCKKSKDPGEEMECVSESVYETLQKHDDVTMVTRCQKHRKKEKKNKKKLSKARDLDNVVSHVFEEGVSKVKKKKKKKQKNLE